MRGKFLKRIEELFAESNSDNIRISVEVSSGDDYGPSDLKLNRGSIDGSNIQNEQNSQLPVESALSVEKREDKPDLKMKRIEKELGFRILTTADIGVDPDYLEATSFAWFAAERIKGRKFDLSKVTGSNREVFLGVITEPAI